MVIPVRFALTYGLIYCPKFALLTVGISVADCKVGTARARVGRGVGSGGGVRSSSKPSTAQIQVNVKQPTSATPPAISHSTFRLSKKRRSVESGDSCGRWDVGAGGCWRFKSVPLSQRKQVIAA